MSEQKANRNTVQKEIVERLVLTASDHPSAETIYLRAREIAPTLSLGTVYRILSNLVKAGVVREVIVPASPSRFDKTTRIHAHFVCRGCGGVSDIMVDEPKLLEEARASNGSVDEAEIMFMGMCKTCACKE